MKQCLIMTVGVPGSGKSTWARAICARKGFVEINRDNLRRELGKFAANEKVVSTPGLEAHVTNVHEHRMISAFILGQTVVCSDTNINPATRERLEGIAKNYNVPVFYKHFNVAWDTLVERNKTRPTQDQVPSKVLRDFYNRYREQTFVAYNRDVTKRDAYIFDVDGTLADHEGLRSPYEWHKVGLDRCIDDVCKMLQLCALKADIIIVSGRDGCCIEQTRQWFREKNLPMNRLFMRPAGNNEKDSIVKYDIFKKFIEPYYNVLGVFDDRQVVVDMWRAIGLTCFQCRPGDF